MTTRGLDHINLRADRATLDALKDFYCDVLGLENGDRPPLGFPGYWLYSGGVATVHLLGERKPREGIVVRVGRYGPFLSCGEKRAAIPDEMPPDEMTFVRALEQALMITTLSSANFQ